MKDEQNIQSHRVTMHPARACITTIHTPGADSSGIPASPVATVTEPEASQSQDDEKPSSKQFQKR